MLTGLMLTAFFMGLGGIAHCAAMCGAPCAAALPGGVPLLALVGRALAYTLLGLVASTGAGLISRWGQQISMLQPIWLMLQLAAVMLGLWLLWTGSMPRQVNVWGQQAYHRARDRVLGQDAPHWLNAWRPVMPLFAGMVWAVMPCGLLYAALMVAALASEPWGGGPTVFPYYHSRTNFLVGTESKTRGFPPRTHVRFGLDLLGYGMYRITRVSEYP